ncbi:MAG TPA: T9SS type A sorting domain-containing protein, partial [Bacteroidota bacterium]|nr:T9SS type A sorting domain-containing protein [Bacteroidota bacterium]
TIIANVTLYTGRRRIQYIQVNRLWNIVSLPVTPIDSLKTNIFPTAISDAYTFEENYNAQDSLREGLGYWLKFDSIHTIGIDGYRLSTDTVDVLEGWNIVGSLSRAVPVGIVSSIPSNIITSEFFSYYRGYQMSDSIYPGKGYWVQVDRPGKLVFSATYYAQTKITKSITPSTFNSLTIADDDGFSQTLYFGKESFDRQYKNKSSLPPKAPMGGFDVRFSSGKWIEIIPDNNGQHREYPIEIQSSSLKITLTWNIRSEDNSKYQIQIKEGEEFLLSNEGKLTLTLEESESRIFKLIIRDSGIPKRFELHQNYPNPFNPVTIINYDLPVASYVTIKVYNVLGNDVVTLVNGVQDAGYKSVQWNAQHIPSGVYLLKIEASSLGNVNEKYNQIRKMVLMR